jgi:ubiquinol-cytochrome c reductase iron-sulfur subunit
MRPAPSTASAALRSWTRHALPNTSHTSAAATARLAPQTTSLTSQRRDQSTAAAATSGSSFDSPFTKYDTNKIPSFAKYKAKSPEVSNRVFQYFMVGSMGLLTAAGAKATVQGMLRELHFEEPRRINQ